MGTSVRKDLQAEKARAFQADPGMYNPDSSKVKQKSAAFGFGTSRRAAASE